MRTVQSIREDWALFLGKSPADFYAGVPMRESEAAATQALFLLIRAEEAETFFPTDVLVDQRAMTPLEKSSVFLMVREQAAYLALLQELASIALPGDEPDRYQVARELIGAIIFPLTRVCVLSKFVIGLVEAGKVEAAKGMLNSVEFDSVLVRFQTVLAVAKLTHDPVDWKIARESADSLLVSSKLQRKHLAKVRARLAIYAATTDVHDLFVARQTALEVGMGPEEAALAHMSIYGHTGDREDQTNGFKLIGRIADMQRRVLLASAFS